MYWPDSDVAQLYFRLTLGGIVVLAAVFIALTVVVCRRADRKFQAHLARLLALPPQEVELWVLEYMAEYEYGTYPDRTLYAQVTGEDSAILSRDEWTMKAVCRIFANAGRPVKNVPAEWLPEASKTEK